MSRTTIRPQTEIKIDRSSILVENIGWMKEGDGCGLVGEREIENHGAQPQPLSLPEAVTAPYPRSTSYKIH